MDNYTESIIGEETESIKVYATIEKYTKARRGLDIGCGGWKVLGAQGIDIRKGPHVDYVGDVTKGLANILNYKRKRRFDYIFSSHLLEDFDETTQKKLVADWVDHLKPGGRLLLYVPLLGVYSGTNCAHKREFTQETLTALFKEFNLTITDCWNENVAGTGYSIYMAGQKK